MQSRNSDYKDCIEMGNIAIIPARSGSKGIKDKNIKELCGKPLLYYSIEAAIKSQLFDEVMVSTDSAEYGKIATEYGAKVPFLRSKENSTDISGSWDAVLEVLTRYKEVDKRFSTVCLLQPTSPLRDSTDIVAAYEYMKQKSADSISSVCVLEYQLENIMRLGADFSLKEYRGNEKELPRQLCPTYYRLNGAIFIRSICYSEEGVGLRNENEYAFLMDSNKSLDIDTYEDFEFAEYKMSLFV